MKKWIFVLQANIKMQRGNYKIISYDCGCSKERVIFPELPASFLSQKKETSYGWKWRNCEFHICIVKEEPNRKKKKEILEKIEKSQKISHYENFDKN